MHKKDHLTFFPSSGGLHPRKLSLFKRRALRLAAGLRVGTGDADSLRHAETVGVVDAVGGLTFHVQLLLRRLEQVAEGTALVLVEAAAAGVALSGGGSSLHHDGVLAAAVIRIVKTCGYITV